MEINMIKFDDFLNNYMNFNTQEEKVEEIKEIKEKDSHFDIYQIVEAKNQDRYLHKHEIKKVLVYS